MEIVLSNVLTLSRSSEKLAVFHFLSEVVFVFIAIYICSVE